MMETNYNSFVHVIIYNKIEVLLNLSNFFSTLNFLYNKDVEDLRSFVIIGFESHEVKTESVEPCIDVQSLCLGFTISNVSHLSAL